MPSAKQNDIFKGLRHHKVGGKSYFYAWNGGPRLSGNPRLDEEAAVEFLRLKKDARKVIESGRFDDALKEFCGSPEHRGRSLKWIVQCQKKHEAILEHFAGTPLGAFEEKEIKEDVYALRDQFADNPRKADLVVGELKFFLNWCVKRGKLKYHVIGDVGRLYKPKQNDRSHIVWTDDELVSLLHKFPTDEQRNVVMLAVYTGLSLSDLLSLTWGQIGEATIKVQRKKTKSLAYIPLLPEARALLSKLPRDGEHVLLSTRGKPWTPDGFKASFQRAKRAAGIDKRFHDLRGTAATRFSLAGLNTRELQAVMGWSNERMNKVYVSEEMVMKAAVEKLGAK